MVSARARRARVARRRSRRPRWRAPRRPRTPAHRCGTRRVRRGATAGLMRACRHAGLERRIAIDRGAARRRADRACGGGVLDRLGESAPHGEWWWVSRSEARRSAPRTCSPEPTAIEIRAARSRRSRAGCVRRSARARNPLRSRVGEHRAAELFRELRCDRQARGRARPRRSGRGRRASSNRRARAPVRGRRSALAHDGATRGVDRRSVAGDRVTVSSPRRFRRPRTRRCVGTRGGRASVPRPEDPVLLTRVEPEGVQHPLELADVVPAERAAQRRYRVRSPSRKQPASTSCPQVSGPHDPVRRGASRARWNYAQRRLRSRRRTTRSSSSGSMRIPAPSSRCCTSRSRDVLAPSRRFDEHPRSGVSVNEAIRQPDGARNAARRRAERARRSLQERVLRPGAHDARDLHAVLEQDQRRDAHHAVASRDVGVVVDVELRDLQRSRPSS